MISIEGRGASSEKMQGEMGDGKIQLTNEKLIGNGSFGVVFQVALLSPFTLSGAHVAFLRNFHHICVALRSLRRSIWGAVRLRRHIFLSHLFNCEQATMVDTGEVVAVKKVLQDKRFKNRELQVEDTNPH